ncbi:MAG TPA: acyltransferase [Terrimicrobiaceae bacterium]
MSASPLAFFDSEPGRLESIDALRGFAFIAVLLVHASQAVPEFPGRDIAKAGAYGVSLFFIASAYTLLASYNRRRSKEIAPLRSFFIRRVFRILPLFWAGILFYFFIDGTWNRGWAEGSLTWFHFTLTALLLHGWHPDTINSVVPGGWSIAAEFGFYMMAPALFQIITTWRRALAGYILACALALTINSAARGGLIALLFPEVAPWRRGSFTWLWLPAHFPTFLLGFLAYHLHDPIRAFTPKMRGALLAGACVCLLIGALSLNGALADFLFPILLAGFAIALIVWPISLLVNRFTCFVGMLSFSAYITHFAALRVMENILPLLPIHLSGFAAFASLLLGTFSLTIVASTITYHGIEKPGIALGRRLVRKLQNTSTTYSALKTA